MAISKGKVNYHMLCKEQQCASDKPRAEDHDIQADIPNNYANENDNYEALKAAYLNFLQQNNDNNFSNENPIVIKSKADSEIEEHPPNISTSNFDCNSNNLKIASINFPMPKNDNYIDKENKRRKQEEYRKYLDMQLKESIERKQREKLEKKGIDLNTSNTGNDIKKKLLSKQIKNEYYAPNQNELISNLPLQKCQTDLLEKDKERKKKLDYQNILRQQIEEKKNFKEIERQRQLEEDRQYDENRFKPEVKKISQQNEEKEKIELNENEMYSPDDGQGNLIESSPNIKCNPYNFNPPVNYHYQMGMPNINLQSTQNPFNNNVITGFQQPLPQFGLPAFFEEMLRYFFQEQMKIISHYKETIDKLAEERDRAIFQNVANREKILALHQLKKEQEKIKSNLGFYPFDDNYNVKIEKMINSIVDNKPANGDNTNSMMQDNLYDKGPSYTKHEKDVNAIGYKKLSDLYFRSKYEDLKQSMLSWKNSENKGFDEDNGDLKAYSKLVKIDKIKKGEDCAFLETWREDASFSVPREVNLSTIKNNFAESGITVKSAIHTAEADISTHPQNQNPPLKNITNINTITPITEDAKNQMEPQNLFRIGHDGQDESFIFDESDAIMEETCQKPLKVEHLIDEHQDDKQIKIVTQFEEDNEKLCNRIHNNLIYN